MIEVEEALDLIGKSARPLAPFRTATSDALGLMLAEDVASDIDSPPYDKSMVDGYALRLADLQEGLRRFNVIEQVTAGQTPTKRVERGQATSIMTGAPIPVGADGVIMVERTEGRPAGADLPSVEVLDPQVSPGGNIVRQGVSMQRGQQVLSAGSELRAVELGLLAEVGRVQTLVRPRPTVSIVSTGDELVEPDEPLPAGMIRNSNGPMLAALVREAGGRVHSVTVAKDNEQELRSCIEAGLQADVLLLSGGVSAGVLDLVPNVLADCGVKEVFHKVRLKPGKPLWFGAQENQPGNGQDGLESDGECQSQAKRLVFGLPGNPVSALVGFKLFIAPTIDLLRGRLPEGSSLEPAWQTARLTTPHRQRGNRPVLHPAFCSPAEQGGSIPTDATQTEATQTETTQTETTQARTLAWRGSADLFALSEANALLYFPAGEREFAVGETVRWMKL